MSKEMYLAHYERLYWEAIDEHGMSDPDAAAWADHRAYGEMRDDLADRADMLRQQRKDA